MRANPETARGGRAVAKFSVKSKKGKGEGEGYPTAIFEVTRIRKSAAQKAAEKGAEV